MGKFFEISWRDEVYRSVDIKANSKEEAYEKWSNGEWDTEDMHETDCQGLSDKEEVMNEISEVE